MKTEHPVKKRQISSDSASHGSFFYTNKANIRDFSGLLKSLEAAGLTEPEIFRLIKSPSPYRPVPVSIFNSSLSPLEAAFLYLKEGGCSLTESSRALNRSVKTGWITLRNADKKGVSLDTKSQLFVPLYVLSDRKLSILESVTLYLKEHLGIKVKEISGILGKSQSTVWTAFFRGSKKGPESLFDIIAAYDIPPAKARLTRESFQSVLSASLLLARAEKEGISQTELLSIARSPGLHEAIPVSAFNNNLAPLEAACAYLLEEGLGLTEAARLLKRSVKTVWITARNAGRKGVRLDRTSAILIPISILSQRRTSILESVSEYLIKGQGLSPKEAARLLGKSPSTIYTAYSRARGKNEG